MADRANRQAEVTPFGPGNKQITSTTDGSKERLDVNAVTVPAGTIAGLTRCQFYTDFTEHTLTGSYTNLFSLNFVGGMVCLVVRGDDKAITYRIQVDSVTVFENNLNALSEIKAQDLSGGALATIALIDGDKGLVLDFRRSRVSTNVTLSAKESGKKVKGVYFHYEVA